METLTIFCPAKLNLFLAVTGRRQDGFHELVSLVSRVSWGDHLEIETLPTDGQRLIECNHPDIPTDSKNLVWRAAEAFAARTGRNTGYRFHLKKRIPGGAGLGGGSSDAVGTLKGLNVLNGNPLGREDLHELAVELGSDCPLFLHDGPVVVRGRGERVEPVSMAVGKAISGRRFALFKPFFGIDTQWAYHELAANAPGAYLEPDKAEDYLREILLGPDRSSRWGTNSFETVVGRKYPAIPVLLDRLRQGTGGAAFLSGSGSACALMVRSSSELNEVRGMVREDWGEKGFLADTRTL